MKLPLLQKRYHICKKSVVVNTSHLSNHLPISSSQRLASIHQLMKVLTIVELSPHNATAHMHLTACTSTCMGERFISSIIFHDRGLDSPLHLPSAAISISSFSSASAAAASCCRSCWKEIHMITLWIKQKSHIKWQDNATSFFLCIPYQMRSVLFCGRIWWSVRMRGLQEICTQHCNLLQYWSNNPPDGRH